MNLLIPFIILFITLVISMPIAFSIVSASLGFFFITDAPLVVIPQRLFAGLNRSTVLALPLFITTGYLMEAGGISKRLINFCSATVGHIKGGLGLVNVLVSMLFAGISGSATADTAAIGSIIIPGMIRRGYPSDFSAAVTASSASIGIIIPPSIPMVLYSVTSGSSIAALFIAGIIPGILVGINQMILVYYFARKYGYPIEGRFSWRRLWQSFKNGYLPLLIPIIILGGITFGVVTPTEAGALAAMVALLCSYLYKTLSIKSLYKALISAGLSTCLVGIIITTSSLFGWVLTQQGVPQKVTAFLSTIPASNNFFLVMISLLLILLGTFLQASAMILIVVPILLPFIEGLGINLVYFGMIVVLGVGIGQQTPPVASALYITSIIAKTDIISITRVNIWFILCIALVLYLVLFFPSIALFLPKILDFM